jgi:hypothetical protein
MTWPGTWTSCYNCVLVIPITWYCDLQSFHQSTRAHREAYASVAAQSRWMVCWYAEDPGFDSPAVAFQFQTIVSRARVCIVCVCACVCVLCVCIVCVLCVCIVCVYCVCVYCVCVLCACVRVSVCVCVCVCAACRAVALGKETTPAVVIFS